MKIMTFNIQSGKNYPDINGTNLNYCTSVIRKYAPDIIGFNEVHDGGPWGLQTAEIAKILGYPYFYFAKALQLFGSDYGNAIISKFPIKKAETIIVPDPLVKDEDTYYETRCILCAEIEGVKVLVTHVGLANSEKKNAVDTVLKTVGESPEKTVLLGDFNMHPDHPLLCKINSVLSDSADYSKGSYFTYPSDVPEEKLDYIFVSADMTVKSVTVPPEIGSDHRAYLCEISF